MEEIIISQSLIKALDEEKGRCPEKARAVYLEGRKTYPSDAMQKGNFFETLVYGGTYSGEKVQLEPLKSGAQSADEIRIRKQAHKLKATIRNEFKMDFAEMHVEIIVKLKNTGTRYTYKLRARIDMISSLLDLTKESTINYPDGFVPRAIVDTKLTESIHSNFGDFAWGTPHLMDHLQAHFYDYVYELKYGHQLPFYYLVMESGPTMDYKFIRKMISATNRAETREAIRRTINSVESYSRDGWPMLPSHDNCKGCPMKAECPMYKVGKDIQVIY